MRACEACVELNSAPSSWPPHPNLALFGAGFFGVLAHSVMIRDQYKCMTCGHWMYRYTSDGDPAAKWRLDRQSDSTAEQTA
ncbi:hypothetical protein AWB81_05352 [Caballeronia arationis]|uniref:hypothetical protein n=1 Tax=Caballeronia arationis TaxID=1777142 RepID=UPI00074D1B26|nr:hypothetical protein [Caballeronia arationis]SAK96058.1 hypothetical protein AWB81_05352 [Caballeronia arationis]